jgi:valyl-tRNA synthetase
VRSWRNEAGVQAGAFLDARLSADGYGDTRPVLARLARLQLSDDPAPPSAGAIVIPGGTVEVLASGAFDPAEAQRKAQAQAADLRIEIARAEGKLSNAGFTDKAPVPVVQAERDKLERLKGELARLEEDS